LTQNFLFGKKQENPEKLGAKKEKKEEKKKKGKFHFQNWEITGAGAGAAESPGCLRENNHAIRSSGDKIGGDMVLNWVGDWKECGSIKNAASRPLSPSLWWRLSRRYRGDYRGDGYLQDVG